MANYNVDISVAIKNTNKLTAFNKQLDKTAETARRARQGLSEIGQTVKSNLASLSNLSAALSKAQKEFNNTVLGTKASVLAARDLATAERMVNKELKERTALMNKFRFQGGGSAFKSFSQRADQITSPNVLTNAQQKSIDRQNRKRGITPTPFGAQPMVNQPFEAVSLTSPQAIRDRIINRRATNFARTGTASSFPKSEGFLAFSKSADKIAAGVKANVKQTTKTASILSQQATRAAFEGMPFGVKGGQIGAAPPPTIFNKMGFGKNANAGGMFAMPGGAVGRLKGGAGSAMIGGGFPFLFGAGGLSAAMGGIAGGIGGALAPGGGFALSIAATAVAAQIEDAIKFRKELKLVNSQLQAVGNSSIFSRKEIKNLAKELNITKEEATQLIDSFVPRFNTEETKALVNVFGKDGIGKFDEIAGATDAPKLINEIVNARTIIGQKKSDELLADLKTKSNLEVQLKLTKEIGEANRRNLLNTLEFNTKIDGKAFKDIINEGDNLQNFIKQLDPNSELGKLFARADPGKLADANLYSQLVRALGGVKFMKEIEPLFRKEFFDFIKPLDDSIAKTQELTEFTKEYLLSLQEFEEFRAPVDEIERLSRATRVVLDVSKELKTSFAESFKGIVKGTMTVTDAFRNMLNRIGDYFLDLAAQVFAAGIQKSFLGLFQNMFNIQMPAINGAMADGGRVRGGGTYLVGERGAELFTPGVSGTITPNESLGGSTNIVVNVDASGSSVEGDEEQGRELGRMISVAIQSELIKQKRPGGLLT